MSNTADTIITAILFVALLPAVVVAFAVGFHLIMLGDGVSPDRPRSGWGVLVGVVGVPLAATATYLAAAILAWVAPDLPSTSRSSHCSSERLQSLAPVHSRTGW